MRSCNCFSIALGVVAVCNCTFSLIAADLPDPAPYVGSPIAAIRFDPVQQPLTAEQLQAALPVKVNTPMDAAELRSSIKRLYATGRYANIAVFAEPAAAGVTLVFRTTEQWFIGPIETKGSVKEPPNLGQLANASRLELGQPFYDESLAGAVDNLKNLLKTNGFYEAAVQPELTRDAEHEQVNITFSVKPGKRARLSEPVIQGDTKLAPEKVSSATKWHGWFRWKQATQENVGTGVQRIRQRYDKDDRLSAEIAVKDMQYDPKTVRVKPIVEADGGPKVKIHADGAKISTKKLKQYVPVFDEGVVDRDLLTQGVRNLRDYYQTQGYFDVTVEFRTEKKSPDQEEIVYAVDLGPRHKLASIEVQGNKYFKTEDLRERMFLQPAGMLRFRHGRYSEGMARRDEDAIKTLYQANGFRDVKVAAESIDDHQGKANVLAVIMHIEEGPQYFVSSLDITGMRQIPSKTVEPSLAAAQGQPFSEANVAVDRDYILRTYQSAGHPDASFDWKMQPGPAPNQIDVHYLIAEGNRRYVRDLIVTGMHTTRMRLVQPAFRLQPGDPLSWTAMGEMQRQLYDLGVFDKVNMAIQNPDGDTDRKYVLYHIVEGNRYAVAFGAGAEIANFGGGGQTSLASPGGTTGFSPRGSFEISRLNLWGLGHVVSLKTRYSTLDRRGLLTYSAPRYRNVDGRNLTFTALYDDASDIRTFSSKRMEGAAQISQKFSKATTGLFRFSYRRVSVSQSTLKIEPLLIPLLSQPVRVGMLSASLIQDRRDNPASAHQGIYNTADLGVASGIFGSQRGFLRFLGRNATYHKIGKDLVLARSLQFGWIHPFHNPVGIDPAQVIPLPERFFGGGGTSLRAFPDNQAGPRDPETGFPVGGNTILTHNTELRFPFIGDNIGGVLFHDMGNVYSSIRNVSFRFRQKSLTDFDYTTHAVGFGIRYRTPVGPLRVDLAYSINPPSFYGLQGTFQQLLFGTATRQLQNVRHFQFFISIGEAF